MNKLSCSLPPASPLGNSGSSLALNAEAAASWLEVLDAPLRGRRLFRSFCCNRTDGSHFCLSYCIDDPADRDRAVARLCQEQQSCATIAYGLGALQTKPECGRRGRGTDVAAVVTFAVDKDLKDGALTKDDAYREIMAKARSRSLPITAVVDSGRGLHAYCMLAAPWSMLTDDDRLAYSERQRFLAAEFGGDHISDLARVLRLPGTWNLKDVSNPLRCRVIHYDPMARIDPDQVPRLPKVPTQRQAAPRTMPAAAQVCAPLLHVVDGDDGTVAAPCWDLVNELPAPLPDAEAATLMARLRRLALADGSLRIVVSPTLCCRSQSEQDFCVVCSLLRIGLSDREAQHVARWMRAIREGEMTAKNSRTDYWAATLAGARNLSDQKEA